MNGLLVTAHNFSSPLDEPQEVVLRLVYYMSAAISEILHEQQLTPLENKRKCARGDYHPKEPSQTNRVYREVVTLPRSQ